MLEKKLKSLECLADKLLTSDNILSPTPLKTTLISSTASKPYKNIHPHSRREPHCFENQISHLVNPIREMKNNKCMEIKKSSDENNPNVTTLVEIKNAKNDEIVEYNDLSAESSVILRNETLNDQPDSDHIKMFVGQIPKTYDERELNEMFEVYGRIFAINVLRDKSTGVSKGCCFVTFYTRKGALRAQDALHNIKTLEGMHHPIQMKPADSENRNERKLFVGMLNKTFNESDVRQLFNGHGAIEECTVLRDQNGQSKGCAFVTFSSKQAAISAIKTLHQSQTMEGCSAPLVVKFADTQKEKEQKKIQQLQTNLWNISGIPTSSKSSASGSLQLQALKVPPILASSTCSTNPLISAQALVGGTAVINRPTQILSNTQTPQTPQLTRNPYLNNTLSLQSLQFQHLQSANLQQQFIHGLNPQSDHNTSMPQATGLMTPLTMQNIFANPLCISLSSHPQLHSNAFSATPSHGLQAQLTNSPSIWTGTETITASYPNHQISTLANGSFTIAPPLSTQPTSMTVAASAVAGKQIEGPESSNLFIYHLPQEFTDIDLASTFLPFGNVLSAKVFIDKQTNLSKCFGFVSYDNSTSAYTAIHAMHGFQIGTKRLKVQLKRSKDAGKPY